MKVDELGADRRARGRKRLRKAKDHRNYEFAMDRKNSNASSTFPSSRRACADSRICRSAEGSQTPARGGREDPGGVSFASLIDLIFWRLAIGFRLVF